MASVDEEQLRLTRGDPAPWGFRIVGGRDFGQPVTVCRVTARSLAEHAGIRVGDIIKAVGDKNLTGVTHQYALDAIRDSGNNLLLTVIRGPLHMPEPPSIPDDVPIKQPPLAHEAPPTPPSPQIFPPNRRESEGVWGLGGLGSVLGRGPGEETAVQSDTPECCDPADEVSVATESVGENLEGPAHETEDVSIADSKHGCSQGSESLTERLLEQLHRVERNRRSKPQPPTTFLLTPDRPPIRQPRVRPPLLPEPAFHKLVRERIKRRKWLAEHPGEDYPFEDPDAIATGRTPTPDCANLTYTRTPTPSEGPDTVAASDLLDNDVDDLSHDGVDNQDDNSSMGQRYGTDRAASESSTLPPGSPSQRSSPPPSLSPSPPPSPMTIAETEIRLQEVTSQLDGLPRLPKELQSELQHLREDLQVIVSRLQEQLDDLRRKQAEADKKTRAEEEERQRREEEQMLKEEEPKQKEEQQRQIEEQQRNKGEEEWMQREETASLAYAPGPGSVTPSSQPSSSFKGPLPDFIHEMTEKLSQERPSFPLTPLPRPIVLPGGRKWRNSRDAFNEDFIAETLSSQAEVLLGHTLGRQLRKDSLRFPALVGLRCDLSVRCCCCGRVNFHKYADKLEHLQNSAVYRAVHGLDRPVSPIAERAAIVPALDDCCLAAQRAAKRK